MTDTATLPADLANTLGPIAAQEYAGASDTYKPSLIEYARNLPTLTDDEFTDTAAAAIYESALVNSFRGNWEHEHFKATACYQEAVRRHVAAGHDAGCRGETLYSRAHARVMREQGHRPSKPGVCTCA